MTELKQLKTYVTEQFRDEFNEVMTEQNLNKSKFISDAIREKIDRDHQRTLPGASAPHGVKTMQKGWKSLFYKDRYQVIAKFVGSGEGFILYHYHEFTEDLKGRIHKTLRTDRHEPAEVTIIDVPTTHPVSEENMKKQLEYAYLEWLPQKET
jgi:hypothetical protein